MKNAFAIAVIAAGISLCAQPPQVSTVAVTQDAATRLVTVSYDLDRDALVTARIYTNGVALAGAALSPFIGDVNALVTNVAGATAHRFLWQPVDGLEGVNLADAVRVELTAWEKDAPPDYLVADLRGTGVRYYASADDLPGGLDDDRYRTDSVVFRRIRAAGQSFKMGSTVTEFGRIASAGNYGNEDFHTVSFTKDFWLAVFETTQYQYWRMSGEWPSSYSNLTTRATRPVHRMSYEAIRGTQWPNGGFDGVGGVLAKVRAVTGLRVDLPTEAQWEFACRAGTTASLNGGIDVSAADATLAVDPALSLLGRYAGNGGRLADGSKPDYAAGDVAQAMARVGSYAPNAWGLYDMHGNAGEYCLDYCNYKDGNYGGLGTADATDPVGATKAECAAHDGWWPVRIVRGGSWDVSPRHCRSAARRYQIETGGSDAFGFRLAIQD